MTRWSFPDGQAADTTREGAMAKATEAAVLVVDVSGFTALTASLEAEHGRRAADRLSVVMDDLLGSFAEIVGAHGGAVIDVVGDSVQAMWPVSEDRPATAAAEAAAHAAQAINAFVGGAREATAAANGRHLPVRTGIAFGPLTMARVGGHQTDWDSLVWGPALLDAAQSATRAAIGAVAVQDRVAGLLRDVFEIKKHEGWCELAQQETEGAAKFAERAGNAVAIWTAELRSASLLFVRLFSIDEAASAQLEQVQRRVLLVQETIAAHGGRLDKVHADEKGIAALVTFGLPPMPIAEAAPRALAAADDLRRELTDLGIDVAIGAATGKVRAGIGNARTHHTIYGGSANLAARCMQACNDEILCDAATKTQAGDTFEFFAPQARTLKGLGDTLAIFGVGNTRSRGARTRVLDTTPIAGRREEIRRIETFLLDPASPRIMLLDGGIGTGKSRLASYAATAAAQHGYAVSNIRAGALANRTPLFAWRDLASLLLRDWARGQNIRIGEALTELTQAGGENPALSVLVHPLFGLELSEAAANAVSDPVGRPRLARRLQAMVLAQLMGGSKRLLIVEDSQWLDEASALLAADLHTLKPELRLLLAGRAPLGPVRTALVEALGADALTEQTAGPLDNGGVAELVTSLSRAVEPAHPVVRWLQSRTGGNPLFITELLRALPPDTLRAGLVSPGAWRDAEIQFQTLDLPQTIEDAAVARLGAQSLERLSLLKAASVLGGGFDREALKAMDLPISDAALDGELDALVRDGLLVAETNGPARSWRFEHDLMRDTVYASLPDRMRIDLHRKAVEHLEAMPVARRRDASAQIAHHWQQAGEPHRALKPLRRAGLIAKNAGAFTDAISFLQSTIAIAGSSEAAKASLGPLCLAQLNFDLCSAYHLVGDYHKATGPGLACLAGLWPGAPKSPFGWGAMAAREAVLLWLTIRLPGVFGRDRRSLRLRATDRLRCETANRLSDCYYFMEGSLPPLALSLYGVRAAERSGDLSVAAAPYAFLAYAAGLMGLQRISKFCSERTIADCQKKNNLYGLRRANGGPLLLAVSLGRWAEAEPLIAASMAFNKNHVSDSNHGMALSVAGQFQRWTGDLARSRETFQELGEFGRVISDDQFVGWSHMGLGRLALCEGDPAAAEAAFDKGLVIFNRMAEVQSLFIFETLRAAALLRQGRYDDVAGLADALLERAEKTPLQFSSGDAHGALVEVMNGLLAHNGNAGGVDYTAKARRALKRARQFAALFPIGKPIVALHEGQLASLSGKPREAAKAWRRGLKIAEALPMKYEAALLHGALAALPITPKEAQTVHASRAAELLAACGAGGLPPLPIEPKERT
ncbi:MAG TPA: AAA family ATPase [Rhizomicrobium sp.]|jgi:class 3 adenylate cyclase/tetratricopeptide (TPR) repeat protein